MLDRGPYGLDPFRTIVRVFAGDAFSPAAHAIGLDAYEQNAAAVDASKARLKKMYERHMNFAQSDRVNFHKVDSTSGSNDCVSEFPRCRFYQSPDPCYCAAKEKRIRM